MQMITHALLLMAPLIILYAIWFTTKSIEKDENNE